MEDSYLPLSTILDTPPYTFMDLDYMDELLLETNVSELSQFAWPSLETKEGPSNDSQHVVDRQRWWIGPRPANSVVDRLTQALEHIKNRMRDKDMLIQVWVPVSRDGKCVLTTHNQPFSLDLNCQQRLAHYRDISVNYQFVADKDSKEVVGLPGRVFMNRVAEWTPDVRLFTWDEYRRVEHAQKLDVRGTLAVPVLEKGSGNCLGVIEVVLTKQKIQFRTEIESAVNLKSADISSKNNVKTTDDLPYQPILPEILDVLKSICETHSLPLAQMWAPCSSQCWRCPDSDPNNCLSPVEPACHVADPRNLNFHEACKEHHLLKGQGIVGKAFGTNQPCFSHDVSACSKTEYPLSHIAHMFGLRAAVAIRLRSVSTGAADFVLEFFLPVGCVAHEEQLKMLDSLSSTIQKVCRTLRVVTDKELKESLVVENNRTMEKKRARAEKTVTLETLRQHFAGSLKDAAKNLGGNFSNFFHGIQRWPSRKIKKVGHSLQKIQRVIDSVHGASDFLQFESFYTNFGPPEPKSPARSPRPTDTSSSSSQCYSSEAQPAYHSASVSGHEGPIVKDEPGQGPVNSQRVKVNYGEGTIRLRMQRDWGYVDLLREITRRFGVGSGVEFHLKYLDDDAEWVLLTCDDDLAECVDLCRSSGAHMIRLVLVRR
ncbi:plant regulator RWP-RK family protein [Striga asiatica]|uniref:Plant regulator RWP-RK family protein n=1 Tax=Striga asiatica TaxID=4170 RepID=A0A5A7QG70_STRAF|nr:plant regulator RWP-RK family protein [Striga asiatica]